MNLSELKNNDYALWSSVDGVLARAARLHAAEGARRLGIVGTHFKKFSVQETYNMINPEAFQEEVEMSQDRAMGLGFWRGVRNIAGLFPLIGTWLALFWAANQYQADLNKYADDKYVAFLTLWQYGFHTATPFIFSNIAIIDVGLLLLYAFLLVFVSILEERATSISRGFTADLQDVTERLCNLAAANTSSMISDKGLQQIVDTIKQVSADGVSEIVKAFEPISDADVQKIVNAIKIVVADALLTSKQVAQQAKLSMEDLFDNQIAPMVTDFNKDLGTLNVELTKLATGLTNYTQQINSLTQASTSIATNAGDLKNSAVDYTNVSKEIRDQIIKLDGTQKQVVSEIQSVAGNMGAAAASAEKVADRTNDVADKLVGAAQKDITTMAARVVDAAKEVNRVASILAQINAQLQNTPGHINNQVQASLNRVDASLQGSINQVDLGLRATADQLNAAATDLQQAMGAMVAAGAVPRQRRGRMRRGQAAQAAFSATASAGQPPKKRFRGILSWLPW